MIQLTKNIRFQWHKKICLFDFTRTKTVNFLGLGYCSLIICKPAKAEKMLSEVNELKVLTRKSLESVFRTQYSQLQAEVLKGTCIKDRLKELIPIIALNCDGETKQEVNGRIRALLVWLDGNSQFQFQNDLKGKPDLIVSYSNLYWGLVGIIIGNLLTRALTYIVGNL